MATIKDIAMAVGCAHSLVSNVLNNTGRHNRVSEAKRALILETAEKMGYHSNLNAKRLIGKPTHTIGMLIAQNLSPISCDIVMQITGMLNKLNYKFFISSSTRQEEEQEIINNFIGFGFDGMIISHMTGEMDPSKISLPSVFLSTSNAKNDFNTDFRYGEYLAVRHLIGHGHRKVGFYCDFLGSNSEKYAGYQDALKEAGIQPRKEWIVETRENLTQMEQLADLIDKKGVRAFACNGDETAARLMKILALSGHRVPEDVALTGCDANFICELTECPLTSIVYPTTRLAEAVIERLMTRIKHKIITHDDPPVSIRPRLFLGGSCGCKPFTYRSAGYYHTPPRTVDYYAGTLMKHIPESLRNIYEFED